MDSIQDSAKPYIQKILGYLAVRIRSRQELIQYVESKTTNSQIIEAVINYLDAHKLIDDAEFARAWAESKLRKHKGDRFIKMELSQKGVAKSIIQSTLEAIDDKAWNAAIEGCLAKYERKLRLLKGYEYKAKRYSILQQRGFSSIHIDAFLNHRVE